MRKKRHRSYGAEVVRRYDAEDLLPSLGSPCLHAPLRSCLKPRENTVNTESEHWNPYVMGVSLTTFFSYNPQGEKRHLSLHPIHLVETEWQPFIGILLKTEQQRPIGLYRPGTATANPAIPLGTATANWAIALKTEQQRLIGLLC